MPATFYKTGAWCLLAGSLIIHAFLAWHLRDLVVGGSPDFSILYTAGKIVARGEGQNLYDPTLQLRVQREFASIVSARGAALPYNHPPFEAWIFVPFARFGYLPAYLLWNLLNLIALAAIPLLLREHIGVLQKLPSWFWVVCSLGFAPIFEALLQGQDSILLLLIFVLTFVAINKGRYGLAGSCLALGMFRFQLVLPMVILLLFRLPRKLALGFSAVTALLILISFGTVGWQTALHYPQYVLRLEASGAGGSIAPTNMPTIQGAVGRLLGGMFGHGAGLATVGLISLMLLVAALVRARSLRDRPLSGLEFAGMTALAVLLSYHAYGHDLSVLWLAVLLAVDYLYSNAASRRSLGVPLFLLCLSPLYLFLRLRLNQLNLLAFVLLWVAWAIWREISQSSRVQANPAHT